MELYIISLVCFRLSKHVFHVFSIVSNQGDLFQCEDVSLAFIDDAKHFNHLEYVECLYLKIDDGL
jgi:hypothetical protein